MKNVPWIPSCSKQQLPGGWVAFLLTPKHTYTARLRCSSYAHCLPQACEKQTFGWFSVRCVCVCAGGRYLADMWMYNLNKLAWTSPSPAEPQAAEATGQEGSALLTATGPPAAAGWSVTPLQDNKLLVMGGHTKAGKVRWFVAHHGSSVTWFNAS